MKSIALHWFVRFSLLITLWGSLLPAVQAQPPSDASVVQAILFYSPTCPHCHDVFEDVLKPLLEQHGERLLIVPVNVREADGQALYIKAIERYAIAEDRRGVPTLIVGDLVLVGGAEIPRMFPGLMEELLAAGGIALPDLPGLAESLARASPAQGLDLQDQRPLSPFDKLARDPLGNGLAVVMLVIMVLVLLQTLFNFPGYRKTGAASHRLGWPVLGLGLVGLGIAGYMAYVETAEVLAVCGPVGDCNQVQQSEYAKLFGIPLGVLGLGGYMLILGAWLTARLAAPRTAALATLFCFLLGLSGTLFSAYLTFLEPFVIGATCAWCLASALCMTLMLITTRKPAGAALGLAVSGSK